MNSLPEEDTRKNKISPMSNMKFPRNREHEIPMSQRQKKNDLGNLNKGFANPKKKKKD